MKIAIVNLSKRRSFQAAVEYAMHAIQKQLRLHFEPHWGFSATLRLNGFAQFPPENSCCRHASYTITATAFDRLTLRRSGSIGSRRR